MAGKLIAGPSRVQHYPRGCSRTFYWGQRQRLSVGAVKATSLLHGPKDLPVVSSASAGVGARAGTTLAKNSSLRVMLHSASIGYQPIRHISHLSGPLPPPSPGQSKQNLAQGPGPLKGPELNNFFYRVALCVLSLLLRSALRETAAL